MPPTGRSVLRFQPTWLALLLAGAMLVAACGGGEKSAGPGGGGGTLRLTVTGLPEGASARVRVTGPSGTTTQYSGTTDITGLVAGTYGVAAGYVNAAGQTYTAALASSSVVVGEGETTVLSVSYVGGPATTLNLRVGHVQLIQSTQRSDGSIPMIANREALVRVYLLANGANSAQPSMRVRLFQGSTQVDSILVLAAATSVPTTVDTGAIDASWNVLLPANRVVAGTAVQVEVDPDDLVAETDKTNNRWPGGNTVNALTVRAVPPMSLRFVPVKQAVNGMTGSVSSSNVAALGRTTRSLFPLGAVTLSVRSTFTTGAPVLQSDDGNDAWGQILGEMYALRSTDHSGSYYMGIVPVTYGGGIAGLGYIGAPAALSWDKTPGAAGVVAHEVGHNFGRYHAPCGNPSGPDASYPYPNANIGTWGIDVERLAVKTPGVQKDLMSYCDPSWVSDYTYQGVLDFRDAEAAVASAAATEPVEGLLIWGRIVNGNIHLEPAISVTAPVRLPRRSGPNRVEGFDGSGQRLFSISFEGDLVTDLPHGDQRHFAYVVPLTRTERARLTALVLTGRGLTASRRQPAALRAGAAAGPSRTATASAGGVVRWDPTYPMAVVRDQATGEILSFGRGGVASVESNGRPITVELSDGVTSIPARLVPR